jgi:hypothetical protein
MCSESKERKTTKSNLILVKGFVSDALKDTFLTYSTTKVVQVPNTKIALIYRLLQLAIVAYIAW